MRTLFLRLLPYLISILGGIIVYVLTEMYVKDESLNGLIANLAASLLGIPLVFICYELVKSVSTSKLNSEILEHLNFEMRHQLDILIKALRKFVPSKKEDLDGFLGMTKSEIKKDLRPGNADAKELLDVKSSFDKLVSGSKHIDLLPQSQLRAVLEISKQIRIFTALLQTQTKDAGHLANPVHTMMQSAGQLADILEYDELISGVPQENPKP